MLGRNTAFCIARWSSMLLLLCRFLRSRGHSRSAPSLVRQARPYRPSLSPQTSDSGKLPGTGRGAWCPESSDAERIPGNGTRGSGWDIPPTRSLADPLRCLRNGGIYSCRSSLAHSRSSREGSPLGGGGMGRRVSTLLMVSYSLRKAAHAGHMWVCFVKRFVSSGEKLPGNLALILVAHRMQGSGVGKCIRLSLLFCAAAGNLLLRPFFGNRNRPGTGVSSVLEWGGGLRLPPTLLYSEQRTG